MNHNLKKAIRYMELNPSLSVHHVAQKFNMDAEWLHEQWKIYKKDNK